MRSYLISSKIYISQKKRRSNLLHARYLALEFLLVYPLLSQKIRTGSRFLRRSKFSIIDYRASNILHVSFALPDVFSSKKKKSRHDLLLITRMPGQDVVMQIQGWINDRKK